jgi:membrane protease YdiL (CAAX protease family)
MPIKLTSRHYKIITVAILTAAACFAIALKYFSRAFPEASIHFQVDAQGSRRIADRFLAARGISLAGYRHAVIFDYDDDAKLYLERTEGLQRMNRLTSGPIHLWRWSHRWFKPLQKEEFRVDVTPAGQVVGFNHEIPETAPGANLTQDQARSLAENFLVRVMRRPLDNLSFVEASTNKRPARTDHTFTWKQKDVDLGQGSLRVEVDVAGGQVTGYGEYVKIPEAWQRDYRELRSRNISAQVVDQVFWIFLSVAMLVILFRRIRDRDVPVRMSFGFGAVAAVLAFLGHLNTFPLTEFSYRTTESFSSFITRYFVEGIASALGVGVAIFLVVAASEPIYRETFPGKVSLRRYLSWNGMRTRSFLIANIIGICLTFFFFAYQTVFYLLANKLGAWAPSDIPFSNELNTRIPWVAVLFTGFFPAVTEEMQFRAFAIPFLKKLTRSWPVALVLAAFNWGFLHSAYPNQPFFIRGLEVGLGGIVTGLIMLRFGILATLIWHYSVDALYTAFLLLRSPNHYLMLSGALSAGIMLIPLILALGAYGRTGTFTDETGLTNAAEGVSRAVEPPAPAAAFGRPLGYRLLTPGRVRTGVALALIGIAVSWIHVYRFGEGLKMHRTRHQAVHEANQYLSTLHVNPSSYKLVAWFDENVDPTALRYFFEREPVKKADAIYRQSTKMLLWQVRYFRPLQKEEYRVFIDAGQGGVFGLQHLLDENAPGASLTLDQARELGEKAVEEHGYKLNNFDLEDQEALKRKARMDYSLVWQAKPGDPRNLDGALYRLDVEIAGDQVVSFSRYFKLPEAWLRHQESSGLANSILLGISILFGAGVAGGVVWLLVWQVKEGAIAWVRSLKVGLVFAGLGALSALNQLSTLNRDYNTAISYANFKLQAAVGYVVSPVALGLMVWLLVGLGTSVYPDAWRLLSRNSRAVWRRDAALVIFISVGISLGVAKLLNWFSIHFHAYAPVEISLAPPQVDAYFPALGVFIHALLYGVAASAGAAIAIYGVLLLWRRWRWLFWLAAVLFLASLGPAGSHSVRQFLAGWVLRFVPAVLAAAMVAFFFRNNAAAYVGAAVVSGCGNAIVSLLQVPLAFYRWNGVVLAALLLIFLAWLLAPGAVPEESGNPDWQAAEKTL